MGAWVHILTNIDNENNKADCANCGRIDIAWRKRGDARKPVCRIAANGNSKSHGIDAITARKIKEGKTCEICGDDQRLVIDHDHETLNLRGVLCTRCNVGLGMFNDNIYSLQAAIKYLEKYNARALERGY